MARVDKVFASGTIAGVIFYELNGKPCARSRPSRVRQSAATLLAGKRFGSSKTISKLLRQSLRSLLPHYRSMAVMHRVDRGVLPWVRTLQWVGSGITSLPGFPCSGEADYNELLRLPIRAVLTGNRLQVTVPALQQISTPAGSSKAVLSLLVSCINPYKSELLISEEQRIAIALPPVAGDDTVLSFDMVQEEGVFIVLSAALHYLRQQGGKEVVMEKPDLKPVAVLQGWYCGG